MSIALLVANLMNSFRSAVEGERDTYNHIIWMIQAVWYLSVWYIFSNEKINSEPATYAKWVMPVTYVALLIKSTLDMIGQYWIGGILFATIFLYLTVGVSCLIAFDKPVDKEARSEDFKIQVSAATRSKGE